MRMVPVSYIMPGMILGRDLYNNNSLLLSRGHVLTIREIQRIIDFQFQAIYITDDLNTDFEISDDMEDINTTIRRDAFIAIKDLFYFSNPKKPINKKVIVNAKSAVNDIVDEVVMNNNVTYSMTDLKIFDDYTYFHSVNVAVVSVILGNVIGLSRANLYKLGLGGLMHDIGKLFVPKDILGKESQLTPEEFEIIKSHSTKGYEYLQGNDDLPFESVLAVLHHHEKYNGDGYPKGLNQHEIPLFGRIIMIADVFDALTSDRPYRKAMLASDAIEYIISGSGELFDPEIVNIFIENISPYTVGTYVMLSTGEKAVVIQNQKGFALRPKVKVINDSKTPICYDLSREFFNITITGVVYS